MFMDSLKETLGNEISVTENGAIGYRTTGKELLDLNFKVSSLRRASDDEIEHLFSRAFYENRLLALKWLFFCRDARQGMGERRLFRVCLKWLGVEHTELAKRLVDLVAEYGRWDDLWCLLDTPVKEDVVDAVRKQLDKDMTGMNKGEAISLLAKWCPSEQSANDRYAKVFIKELGITPRQYRKMLSKLRSHLKVVETYMSKKEWGAIDYSAVPSRANLIYNSAFLRNDEDRRREYLGKLERGETKINAGVLFPHDIVNKYIPFGYRIGAKDATLEELWKALPDFVNGTGNTMVVADGSGSMTIRVSHSSAVRALDVANALAIYFAERCKGQFKNQYITFSMMPQLVQFGENDSLRDKLRIALSHNECANTNIEAVFDLILETAISKHMDQSEIPENILILSDMEFDACARTNASPTYGYSWNKYDAPNATLFSQIAREYKAHGYKLPRLVFWNIGSRTGTIPVRENDLGVALVSGFSPAIAKMVLSGELDPYKCLVNQLNTERYQPVEDAIADVLGERS